MRKVLRKIFGLAGLFGIILGMHGVYIHFTKMTTYSIEEMIKGFPSQNKLFTVIPVGPLGDTIRWMSDCDFLVEEERTRKALPPARTYVMLIKRSFFDEETWLLPEPVTPPGAARQRRSGTADVRRVARPVVASGGM